MLVKFIGSSFSLKCVSSSEKTLTINLLAGCKLIRNCGYYVICSDRIAYDVKVTVSINSVR